MNFDEFSAINRERNVSDVGFESNWDEWSIAEWTNALCGEAGEAANFAKKIIRLRSTLDKLNKTGDKDKSVLEDKLAEELADTIMYADLTLGKMGRNTMAEVIKKFNKVSKEMCMPDKFIIK